MVPDTLMVTEMMLDERTTMSTLQLLMVQPIYASEYSCRASNDLGIDEATANLVVHGKYKFKVHVQYSMNIIQSSYSCDLGAW